MFKRILMVCVGNICRSPMAEVLLRRHLHDKDVAVESAGLAALTGRPIDATAEAVLAAHGLTGQSHVARQISRPLIDAADLILVMERKHLHAIHRMTPHASGRTFLLGKWQGDVDVPDPYRQQRAAFEHVYRLIDTAVDSWRIHL